MNMADIEVVVKISKKTVNEIKDNVRFASSISNDILRDVIKAIVNGTILPKGHGDIVDIETLIDMFWDGNSMEITERDLSIIEPLIEADNAESE